MNCPETRRAIVVLGCRVRLDPTGRLAPVSTLAARVEAAALEYRRCDGEGERPIVVTSGGRRWGGHTEADVMARELARLGVPNDVIVRERASLSTRDNAVFSAALLGRRGIRCAVVVTSDWHLPRAVALFRREGLTVRAVPAPGAAPEPGLKRLWRDARERLLALVDRRRA